MAKKGKRAPKKPAVRKKPKRTAPKRKGGRMSDAATLAETAASPAPAGRSSPLIDTRIIYCGDCLDQLRKLPDACVDLIYIDPPFNSNRNYEVFWGGFSEPRPSGSGLRRLIEDRHASTQAYIEYMRPRCVELARVLKKTGSFFYSRVSELAAADASGDNGSAAF